MSISVRFACILFASMVGVLLTAGEIRAGVSLQWQDVEAGVDQQAMTVLADSRILSDFVEMVDQNFELDPPLALAIGASEGPSMNVETHVLNLPHGYLSRAIVAQSELVEGREEALQRALDVVEYTLYYLLGHALVDGDTAKGDDASVADRDAEALSTWVMLSHWPNGGEQWFADVSAFADASQKLDGPVSDFWHEHSLYKLREDQITCWILGKDPAAYARLLPAVRTTGEERRQCVESWNELDDATVKSLDAVLRHDAPVRFQ